MFSPFLSSRRLISDGVIHNLSANTTPASWFRRELTWGFFLILYSRFWIVAAPQSPIRLGLFFFSCLHPRQSCKYTVTGLLFWATRPLPLGSGRNLRGGSYFLPPHVTTSFASPPVVLYPSSIVPFASIVQGTSADGLPVVHAIWCPDKWI